MPANHPSHPKHPSLRFRILTNTATTPPQPQTTGTAITLPDTQ